MADDGMLLNLSFDIPPSRKRVARDEKDRSRGPREISSSNGIHIGKRFKSDKGDGRGDRGERGDGRRDRGEGGYGRDRRDRGDKGENKKEDKKYDNTFTSSLFSKNPDQIKVDEEEQESQPNEASNAPLVGGDGFQSLGVGSKLANILNKKMAISKPTKIQKAALPKIFAHERDIFISAQTGSGKTLSYLLPIMEIIMRIPNLSRDSGLFAVIISPTRELGNQIFAQLEILRACCSWIVPGLVIGGEKKKAEKARIRKGVNILVGTPGRMADHFETTQCIELSQVKWVVLDEGDRLMELGFEEQIKTILNTIDESCDLTNSRFPLLPKKRMTILCSATMQTNVKKLGEMSLKDAEWISESELPDQDQNNMAPAQLTQQCIIVPAKLRTALLSSLLVSFVKKHQATNSRAVVFISCSDSVEFYYSVFTNSQDDKETTFGKSNFLGVNVFKLHGSLDQSKRTKTLVEFSDGKVNEPAILFCTDVASRGLDLPLIKAVIEFDPPFSVPDHIHRVGRTARAGHEGSSTILLLPGEEEGYVDKISSAHENKIQMVPYEKEFKNAFGGDWQDTITSWHLSVERRVLDNEELLKLAKNAFQSHIRAYTTHISDEKKIFNVKALHLGHLAKSFALRETPGNMSNSNSKGKKKVQSSRNRLEKMAQRHLEANEFNLG